jgi:hypothetical protein
MKVTTGAAIAASAVLLSAAYGLVYRPLETAIAARYDDLDTLRENLARDRRIIAQASEAGRAVGALRTTLHTTLDRTPPEAVERFLADLDAIAGRSGVEVQAVVPRSPAGAELESLSAETGPYGDLHLDLTLRGSYPRVIRVVRALDARLASVQLTVATLRVARLLPGSPTEIDATFHVTLLGGEPDATTAPSHHPA